MSSKLNVRYATVDLDVADVRIEDGQIVVDVDAVQLPGGASSVVRTIPLDPRHKERVGPEVWLLIRAVRGSVKVPRVCFGAAPDEAKAVFAAGYRRAYRQGFAKGLEHTDDRPVLYTGPNEYLRAFSDGHYDGKQYTCDE